MLDTALQFLREAWAVLAEMSPYLLLGFAAAGVLNVLISRRLVEKHLGGEGFLPSLKAATFGVPMPLCSCGVIPVSTELRRSGSGKGPTLAFLIATPQTGVDSILVTWSLMGWVFGLLRPLISLVTGLVGGSIVSLLARRSAGSGEACCGSGAGHAENHTHSEDCSTDEASGDTCCSGSGDHDHDEAPRKHWLVRMVHHGFVELPEDIGKALLVGLLISAVITTFTPEDFFQPVLGGGILAMLAMSVLGIPMYVCATASVPVAAALIARGASPGAALVFLMTGPATNAATIATIWKVMGKSTAAVYLLTVFVCAILAGLGVDLLLAETALASEARTMTMVTAWWQHVAGVVLLGILGWAMLGRRFLNEAPDEEDEPGEMKMTLAIRGMTCHHCVQAIQRALQGLPRVSRARVDLRDGRAVVAGSDLDPARLVKAVEELGYSVAGEPQPAGPDGKEAQACPHES